MAKSKGYLVPIGGAEDKGSDSRNYRFDFFLGGTRLMTRVKVRYQNEPFVVAGTSAGAMAMSSTMICDGSPACWVLDSPRIPVLLSIPQPDRGDRFRHRYYRKRQDYFVHEPCRYSGWDADLG